MLLKQASVALFALLLASCSHLNLPPIAEPSGQHLPGKIVWHDLISGKPAESQRFYEELFGWQFEHRSIKTGVFSSVDYYLITNAGKLIGGMVDQEDLKQQQDNSQWVSVISTDNIAQSVATAKAQGAKTFGPIVDLQERGQLSVMLDNQGALFALLEASEGDPQDSNNFAVGDFLWNELWVDEVDKATGFYSQFLPYSMESKELESEEHQYRILESQGEYRAGVLTMPVKDLTATWVSYLRVENKAALDAVLAKVEDLGGVIYLPAQKRDIGGYAALIAGPSGAGIALQTWPAHKNAENNQ